MPLPKIPHVFTAPAFFRSVRPSDSGSKPLDATTSPPVSPNTMAPVPRPHRLQKMYSLTQASNLSPLSSYQPRGQAPHLVMAGKAMFLEGAALKNSRDLCSYRDGAGVSVAVVAKDRKGKVHKLGLGPIDNYVKAETLGHFFQEVSDFPKVAVSVFSGPLARKSRDKVMIACDVWKKEMAAKNRVVELALFDLSQEEKRDDRLKRDDSAGDRYREKIILDKNGKIYYGRPPLAPSVGIPEHLSGEEQDDFLVRVAEEKEKDEGRNVEREEEFLAHWGRMTLPDRNVVNFKGTPLDNFPPEKQLAIEVDKGGDKNRARRLLMHTAAYFGWQRRSRHG